MATEYSSVTWREPYAIVSPLIYDINYEKTDIIKHIKPTQSFLHSHKLKQSLNESKKVFLNLSLSDQKPEDDQMEEKSIVLGQIQDQKKLPTKKISFKVKKQSSLYRKNAFNIRTPLSTNKVAELTKKFNEMGNSAEEKEKPVLRSKDSIKVSRKPSVKTKPTFDGKNLVVIKSKPSVDRKPSLNRKQSGEMLVRAKIGYIEVNEEHAHRPKTLNLNLNIPTQILETSPNGTSVKAAIEIFEKKSANSTPQRTIAQIVPKPKVPEKSSIVKSFGKNTSTPIKPSENVDSTDNRVLSLQKLNIEKTDTDEEVVQIINIPAILPQRRCDSMYETLNLKRVPADTLNLKAKSEESIVAKPPQNTNIAPNSSFLWREKPVASAYNPVFFLDSQTVDHLDKEKPPDNPALHSKIDGKPEKLKPPDVPPRPQDTLVKAFLSPPKVLKKKMPLPNEAESKDYEEIVLRKSSSHNNVNDEKNKGYEEILSNDEVVRLDNKDTGTVDDGYEPIGEKPDDPNDGYEYCSSKKPENIYETLPAHKAQAQVPLRRSLLEPLPPRPPSSCIAKSDEHISNCYESINYQSKKPESENNYESIYGSNLTDSGSNRDSVLSSDNKTNSLYGKVGSDWDGGSGTYKAASDLSSSDRSDEWVDVTDNEEAGNRMIIVREKQKSKKSGWSQHFREQWSKTQVIPNEGADSDSDHLYESLYTASKQEEFHHDDYDSFDSESESEHSFDKCDSGVDISNTRLPDPPNTQPYGIIKFAEKQMKNFGKSLRRMTKRISKTDMDLSGLTLSTKKLYEKTPPPVPPKVKKSHSSPTPEITTYQNVEYAKTSYSRESSPEEQEKSTDPTEKTKSLSRKSGGFLTKFRRSMSISAETATELTNQLNNNKTKSKFYVTETIDVDEPEVGEEALAEDEQQVAQQSPVLKHPNRVAVLRPQGPPPPAPIGQNNASKPPEKREQKSASWYTEAGLFPKNEQTKRPNTFWYAEVGLYQPKKNSSASTSSGENSGSTTNSPIRPTYFINQDNKEELNNLKNDSNNVYGGSVNSFSSLETKKDESLKNVIKEIQLRLQDEPLYQFYDAAVLESACYDSTSSEFDSDNYEEVTSENESTIQLSVRPTAMELVSPKRNSICFNRTLWCEIPEVINSSVLSTLSSNQKKLQEAKFELLTSEASYLNSLHLLRNHFVKSFEICDIITAEERNILFGRIKDVTHCSEKLLLDLETCWQDNILLHNVCDIVQKHADENFSVYVPYCENQVILDDTLKQLKERPGFTLFLKQLESNTTCQSLSLYSFLMLPMQRITRWPLLIDAVLKRIDQQDKEYYTCQYALATLNKIVNQCNEAARVKERETELIKISDQLEFSSQPIKLISPNRWLVRSGIVTKIQPRNDDTKLTFGKRFNKIPLHLFLFNDLLCVSKEKSENSYIVTHYCPRNLIEISSSDVLLSIPGKNLLFLTLLENQEGKTIEMMLSFATDSDKERWVEAFTPPRSEDPEETLYECWDCPQVTAMHSYVAVQPDELALTKGDVINVLRKMADGWYHGERIRDGHTGWFPANHTEEIANPHVRARNLKQRYRLLAYSENYLKSK